MAGMTTTTGPSRAPLLVLLTGQAMASMDTSIAAVAAPTIRADLTGPPALTQLVLAGYTLAFAVLVVTGARLGARHGPTRSSCSAWPDSPSPRWPVAWPSGR
ncbi:hypothetical protein NKG94_46195 [Micromonospora sp. M12]